MGAAKTSKPNQVARLRARVQATFELAGRGFLITVAVLALGFVALLFAWGRWGKLVTSQPGYLLTAEKIEITPPPPWIQADIRADVMRDGGLAGLSLLDPDAAPRIGRAFEAHTWVAKCDRAIKKPDRVIVELRYRRPILMVEASPEGFWPVDTEGVLLPSEEFSKSQTRDHLRVRAANSHPAGVVGAAYGDARIVGAAAIAVALDEIWKELDIYLIDAVAADGLRAASRTPTFELVTRQGARVVWGSPPGNERTDEPLAAEKIDRLLRYVGENGPLDGPSGPSVVDLTNPQGVKVTPRMARRNAG